MPEVWIPPAMQRLTSGREQVRVAGATLRQVVNNLEKEFPGIRDELCLEDAISPGLAVIIDGETANLGMLERVKEESEVHFIPAIAGGSADSAPLSIGPCNRQGLWRLSLSRTC